METGHNQSNGVIAPLEPDVLFTPEATAAHLGISAATLKRWDRAGKISSTRTLGNHRRYTGAEIERIRSQR